MVGDAADISHTRISGISLKEGDVDALGGIYGRIFFLSVVYFWVFPLHFCNNSGFIIP